MPKLHTSDLLEKFCSNEKHVYMKSVVLCAKFIAVVVYRKEVEGWGEIEEEEREGDKEEERGGEKGSYRGIIHSDYI